MIRASRFGVRRNWRDAALIEEKSARVEVITPTLGVHRGDAPQDLSAGFSPDCYNFDISSGHIAPRSGLSAYNGGVSHLSGAALGAWRMFDTTGNEYLLYASDRTFGVFDPTPVSHSTLSWIRPSSYTTGTPGATPSNTSADPWHATWIYDANVDANIGVFTNNIDVPKAALLKPSLTTYSDLTGFTSLASKAAAVAAFDNRLVWFNVSTSASSYPTRVMWSARGLPQNYQLLDGAGYEDLLDMQGIGTGIVSEREGVLLLTDEEIWRGRKRGDAYVFDFYPIERHFGAPYAKTVTKTPAGTFFLGRDLEVYLVNGDHVQAIGSSAAGEASRIQQLLSDELYNPDRAWGVYNPAKRRYELYFVGANANNGYASKALFFHLVENSFMPQRFSVDLSAGVEYSDSGDPQEWDFTTLTWDEITTSWNDQVTPGSGYNIHAFSSDGTHYRYQSSQTNDDGTEFDCRWTSHGLNRPDGMRYEQLTEVWLQYKATRDSNCSIVFGNDALLAGGTISSLSVPIAEYGRVLATGHAVGVSPQFRVEIRDGSQIQIARMQARLVEGGLY